LIEGEKKKQKKVNTDNTILKAKKYLQSVGHKRTQSAPVYPVLHIEQSGSK
jgi:hypothetical protein